MLVVYLLLLLGVYMKVSNIKKSFTFSESWFLNMFCIINLFKIILVSFYNKCQIMCVLEINVKGSQGFNRVFNMNYDLNLDYLIIIQLKLIFNIIMIMTFKTY